MKQLIIFTFLLVVSFTSCKEQYEPPLTDMPTSFLVVEGNLAPSGATSVRLTKTSKLNGPQTVLVENNAQLTVEGKDNTVRNLAAAGNGTYTSPALNLIIGNEYRLKIRTAAGKEYLSAYVKARITPEIDSVSWERTNDGIQLYTNTHDATGRSTYYTWRHEETWELHSPYGPDWIYVNGTMRPRVFPQESVSVCWRTITSTEILLGNSTRLNSDVISKARVSFIYNGDEKLFFRYSILVKQYALDKDAYNFFELMKTNTENIGSFFGPLPSEIRGNVTCTSAPDEPVIGFVTASTMTEKRLFLTAQEVSPWPASFYCTELRVRNHPDSIRGAIIGGYMVVTYTGAPPDQYIFSEPRCVDCTIRGGSTTRPSFW